MLENSEVGIIDKKDLILTVKLRNLITMPISFYNCL